MTHRRRPKSNRSVVRRLNEVNTRVNKKSSISLIMLFIILLAVLMIGFVWQKIKYGQLISEIETLRKQELALIEQREKTKALALNLSDNARIIGLAQDKLQMTFPEYEVVSPAEDYHDQQEKLAHILTADSISVLKKYRNSMLINTRFAEN